MLCHIAPNRVRSTLIVPENNTEFSEKKQIAYTSRFYNLLSLHTENPSLAFRQVRASMLNRKALSTTMPSADEEYCLMQLYLWARAKDDPSVDYIPLI